jgi:predicted DNA-binding transcriptional regulator YafY
MEAIKANKKVFLTTKNANKRIELSPYAVAGSKEELHLYVIGAQRKSAPPIRLSRIVSVKQLSADAEIAPEQEYIFKKMLRYGPQFVYSPYEKEVLVRLTEEGIKKFKKIYVHRPVPFKVEGNRYYFECSYAQILQYFIRLGEDAEIVYPKKLRAEIFSFHHRAAAVYDTPLQ